LGVCLFFSGIFDDFERYALALVEGGHASPLDGADMNEHVWRAIVRPDEAEALCSLKNFTVPTVMAPPGVSPSRTVELLHHRSL
jgi:hypothetical protein